MSPSTFDYDVTDYQGENVPFYPRPQDARVVGVSFSAVLMVAGLAGLLGLIVGAWWL